MSEVDQNKLVEILRDNGVRISKKGNICLSDLVTNVIESKSPKTYIDRKLNKYDTIAINDRTYVSREDCVDIIKDAKFKKCKDIYTKIVIDDGDGTSIIDVEQQIFQFEGHKFLAFFVDDDDGKWDVWIKGSEAAEVLGYADKEQAVRDHVMKKNKCAFGDLMETLESVPQTGLKNIHPQTMFINMSGFFNLIHKSTKKAAKRICSWIDDEVLPSLIRYGVYVMQPAQIKITKLYNKVLISKYARKPGLYIIYVGKYDGIHLFKYGLTRNIEQRIYDKHRKTFKKCRVIYVGECANCEAVEQLFKEHMISMQLHRERVIKGKKRIELFTVTTSYTHDDAIAKMIELIDENKLPEMKEAADKITALSNVIDTYKQSEEVQKLAYEYRQSDNYRLELRVNMKKIDTDLKIAQLDSETRLLMKDKDIALKNIELETERARLTRAAIEKGVDIGSYVPKTPSTSKKQKFRKNIVVLN